MRTIITDSSHLMTLVVLLIITTATTVSMTEAFGIYRPAREGILRTVGGRTTRLEAFSFHQFHSAGSLLISDDTVGDLGIEQAASDTASSAITTATETAIATATAVSSEVTTAVTTSETAEAFTDQIDFFGDPTIRILFLVFGGVVLLLAGLSVLSQKVDAAIENVVVDFESVLKTNPEFRSKWLQEIEPRLKEYDDNSKNETAFEKEIKRKQKLFEIMEEMQQKEPALMKRINAKMEALKNN